jgi:hypothetical protein
MTSNAEVVDAPHPPQAVEGASGPRGPNRDDCSADSEATFDQGKTYTTLSNVTLGLGMGATFVGRF